MDPKTLFGIRNLTFGGVILLTFFDLSYGFIDFWGRWCKNVEFSTPKPMLGSKNVRSMTERDRGRQRDMILIGLGVLTMDIRQTYICNSISVWGGGIKIYSRNYLTLPSIK